MKKLSIKLKLTLYFTIFMLVLAGFIFAFVSLLSGSETRRRLESELTAMVNANAREVHYSDRQVRPGEDFIDYRRGFYCLVFTGSGELTEGHAPDEALVEEPLSEGPVREITADGETYLVYDLLTTDKRHEIWLRGIVSVSGGEIGTASVYTAVLISIPLLILLAAIGGYLLAGRSLKPIEDIRRTAEEIGESGDLSRRIEMDGNGDELHRLAGSFNGMFERLEANFEAEKQFTSDASHELRTPITTILAQCEYAFEDASGEEELYEVIGDIQKQGYRMQRLVESLLSFTRLDMGTAAPDLKDMDLSACTLAVCREQAELPEKNIALIEEITPGIRLIGDETLLSRLIANLIRNAYRYGRENGHITVKLAKEGGITLSVADDGIGISKEDLPKIWNRFYRADKARTAGEGAGLGLGLAMVKQIAELHGAKVSVVSTLGEGSCFTVQWK